MVTELIDGDLVLTHGRSGPDSQAVSSLAADVGSAFGHQRSGLGGWIIHHRPELHAPRIPQTCMSPISRRCVTPAHLTNSSAEWLAAGRPLRPPRPHVVTRRGCPAEEFIEPLLAEGATRLIADLPDVELPDPTYEPPQVSVSRDAREAEVDRTRRESEDWAEDAYIDMMGDTSAPMVVRRAYPPDRA